MPQPAFIKLTAATRLERQAEWRPWKPLGYRVLDPDGVTVWHEQAAIRRLVLAAFANIDADLFLFGSRAKGEAGPYSDYDIGYYTTDTISPRQIAQLAEQLEEMPIPARVDLVDFSSVSTDFRALVLQNEVKIWRQQTKNSLFTIPS